MLRPIKNEQQYEDALSRVYMLMQKNIKPDSKESDELEILSVLIKEYENEHYVMIPDAAGSCLKKPILTPPVTDSPTD